MNRAECARILAVIAAAYTAFAVDDLVLGVWHTKFEDLTYQAAETALRRHLALSPFPPTIADIRKQVAAVFGPEDITAGDAWGELMEAVRRFYVPKGPEALASMRPSVARVAQMIGWRQIYLDDNVPALRAHFMRMFEQVQERERREAQLPPSLTRAALTQAAEALPAGSEGLLDSAHGSDAPSQSQLGAPEGT